MTLDKQTPLKSMSHAALARLVGAWIQPVFVIALFILWRVRHWPLASATEACIVVGVLVYSALNVYAALASAWGNGVILAARVSRLAGVIMFILMRYALHYNFWQAAGVWIALWIVAAMIARKARRRAVVGAPVRLTVPERGG